VQGLHGDVPEALRRDGRPIMVNTVWMLDDFTSELGATRVVPGSHRMPQGSPPPERSLPLEVQAIAPAGSVLIFDGRCWHGGGANRTTRDRHALFGHYRVGSWMLFQCDPHHGFDPKWHALLNDRQRRLLRMSKGVRGQAWIQDT
jgi:ectoine hydroxylase-related dioxygenase (phytanoyl-CoA dioxygenase family)